MRMNGALGVALLLSALLPAGAALAQDSTAIVSEIYNNYVKAGAGGNTPDLYTSRWYSKKLNRQIAALKRSCRKQDYPCGPGADYFVDGQDFEIKNLRVREVSRSGDKAVVEARATNMGTPLTATFDMVLEDGRFVIDEMRMKSTNSYTLSKILKKDANY